MFFSNEKITEKVYLLRGYESEQEDNYCTVMLLCRDEHGGYEMKGFLSARTLTITEIKAIIKYLQSLGMTLYANVLKTDFKRFYGQKSFKKIVLS